MFLVDSLPVQCQLHNWLCNNSIIAMKSICAIQDPLVAGKLKAAAGLAFLQAKKYKQAAKRFTEVGPGYLLVTVLPKDQYMHRQVCVV